MSKDTVMGVFASDGPPAGPYTWRPVAHGRWVVEHRGAYVAVMGSEAMAAYTANLMNKAYAQGRDDAGLDPATASELAHRENLLRELDYAVAARDWAWDEMRQAKRMRDVERSVAQQYHEELVQAKAARKEKKA